MLKQIRKVRYKISNKFFYSSMTVFILSITVINFFSAQLKAPVLDFKLGYNTKIVYNTFEQMGEGGRILYTKLLIADFFFPIVYTIFAISLLSFILNKYKYKSTRLDLLFLFPIMAMIFDWSENIMLFLMIKSYNIQIINLGHVASVMTALKFIFLSVFLIITLLIVANNMRKKHENNHDD